jgi:hypothetical protein
VSAPLAAPALTAPGAGLPTRVGPLLPVDPATFVPHPLHAGERVWAQTNCYVDLWVELLHAAGLDPVPVLAGALSADFDGTQWTFLKPAPEDLRRLLGVEVAELNLWRPLAEHVAEELGRGRLLTVECDAFFLPDTRGTDYREAHTKTTVVVNELDLDARRATYFHNDGFHELVGDDLVGALRLDEPPAAVLLPYVEVVRLDAAHPADPGETLAVVLEHLRRAPAANPVAALADRVQADLGWLRGAGLETFHRWSFGVLRQCGFTAELAADVLRHADALGLAGAADAAAEMTAVAQATKAVQFRLARVARGRAGDPGDELAAMAQHWAAATELLARHR